MSFSLITVLLRSRTQEFLYRGSPALQVRRQDIRRRPRANQELQCGRASWCCGNPGNFGGSLNEENHKVLVGRRRSQGQGVHWYKSVLWNTHWRHDRCVVRGVPMRHQSNWRGRRSQRAQPLQVSAPFSWVVTSVLHRLTEKIEPANCSVRFRSNRITITLKKWLETPWSALTRTVTNKKWTGTRLAIVRNTLRQVSTPTA